ncbi:MAG: PAS domain S-box protein, partial [Bacteroidetes bacterium]|nr:PAS domain S-box protein [Bacteroidota bacterium]
MVKKNNKTNEQLLDEITLLKVKIAELEKSEAEPKLAEIALKSITTQFSAVSGLEFFEKVCRHLTETLQMDYAFVGELSADEDKAKVIAGVGKGKPIEQFIYDLANTPCKNVIGQSVCSYPFDVQRLFPKDYLLIDLCIEGYIAIPLFNRAGSALGIMVLLDSKPITNPEIATSLLQIFSERVASEMERNQAEEMLRESEIKYRSIFESLQDIYYRTDTNGIITEISPSVLPISGYEPKEVIGKPVIDVFEDPAEQAIIKKIINESGKVTDYEIKLVTKDKKVRIGSISAHTIMGPGGEINGIEGIIRDITERKKTELAFKISEKKYRDMFELSPVGIYQSTLEGKFLDANKSMIDMLGYDSFDDLLKLNMAKDVYYDKIERDKVIKEYVKIGIVKDFELRWSKKNGDIIWVLLNARAVKDSNKKIIFFEGIVRDITERKKVEEELKESEGMVRTIVETSQDWIWTMDINGVHTFSNSAIEGIL